MTPPVVEWCRRHVASVEVQHVGREPQFAQEDQGPAIGAALRGWLSRVRLHSVA